MGKRTKNRYYAYEVEGDRGVVGSWTACEQKVKGRKARYRGFPDRASAERWLAGEDVADKGKPRKFYAYRTETEDGVEESWDACERKVQGHKARYRGFSTRKEALAWLAAGAPYEDKEAVKAEALRQYPADAVFFDAGTGAGRGVELRVTNREGDPIVHLAGDPPEGTTLTKEGNLLLGKSRTNNYGELLACRLALAAADAQGAKRVYGDSRLVLGYWSKGYVSQGKRDDDPDLAELAKDTARARKAFERRGGRLGHIPGGLNPADLGYHRD